MSFFYAYIYLRHCEDALESVIFSKYVRGYGRPRACTVRRYIYVCRTDDACKIPERAMKVPMEGSQYLVSIIGVGNTIGRIALGFVSSLPGVDALLVNNIFITISGLLTIFSGVSLCQEYQFFFAAAFGLSVCEYIIARAAHASRAFKLDTLINGGPSQLTLD